jgi:hypothetical protein
MVNIKGRSNSKNERCFYYVQVEEANKISKHIDILSKKNKLFKAAGCV